MEFFVDVFEVGADGVVADGEAASDHEVCFISDEAFE